MKGFTIHVFPKEESGKERIRIWAENTNLPKYGQIVKNGDGSVKVTYDFPIQVPEFAKTMVRKEIEKQMKDAMKRKDNIGYQVDLNG